jgi:hypothetical protein
MLDRNHIEKMCQAWMQSSVLVPPKPFRQVVINHLGYEPDDLDEVLIWLKGKGYPVDVAPDHQDPR